MKRQSSCENFEAGPRIETQDQICKNKILNPEEIAERITECEKEESIVQNTMESSKEIINTELESEIGDKEIVHMSYNLEK